MSNAIAGDENSITITAEVVSAYLTNHSVVSADLPALISSVHQAVRALTTPTAPEAEKPVPPVPIKKSITPDHLISLEDGKPYKSLKRHLSKYGLTPAEYRRM
jgi:predicted transcriptional regulator